MAWPIASNDLKGQNSGWKFLLPPSIVILDQKGVFFCSRQIGFVVTSVVIVEDWFCCGKCCYYESAQPGSNPVVALTGLDSAPATKCHTWIPWNIRLGLDMVD